VQYQWHTSTRDLSHSTTDVLAQHLSDELLRCAVRVVLEVLVANSMPPCLFRVPPSGRKLARCLFDRWLQDQKPLPYRPNSNLVAATKDLLNPPCVAGQLGGTAEPTVCDITSEAQLQAREPPQCGSTHHSCIIEHV
jgi:hypothetical protein